LTTRNAVSGRGGESSISASFIGERETYSITDAALADLSQRNQLIALGLDPRTGVGGGFLGAIAVDFRRSTTSNVLNASRGYTVLAHAERAGGWLPGDFNYKEYTVEARHYQTIPRFGVVAHRVRIATIDGDGDDQAPECLPSDTPVACRAQTNVPFFKRYFLGGSNSLRGWGRFEVAPLSGSGLPLGGHSLLEMSSELRVAAFGNASLVAFVDAGSVATASWDIAFKDLRYDAGPGFRYMTPIGPLRIDFARQLDPIPGLLVDGAPEVRHWRVHFSLGQAF
jgi:outer membrane translocation and assembly module TamA